MCSRVLSGGGRSRRRRREPVRARLWPSRASAGARAAVLSAVPGRHESRRARRRRLHLPDLLGVHVAHVVGAGDRAPSREATTCTPATSISSWRASARWRCCSPSACWPVPTAATPSRRSATASSSPTVGALVLILTLIGAGSKAGLVPLHAWLPLAHPAAPSHVSALMSGVMTKVAVYGFVRIVFDLSDRRPGGGAWSCSRSPASPASWACSMR